MYEHEKRSLEGIRKRLDATFGDRIVSMYAFGSRVRGDHDVGSDFDLLIIVREKTPELEAGIVGVIVDEELGCGLSFTPVVKDISAFDLERRFNTHFYENVVREGILI